MTDTMEFMDTLVDTIAMFPDVFNNLTDVETAMSSLDGLHNQSLWTGDAKEKCVLIHGLLKEYHNAIKGLIEQLQTAVIALEKDMQSFPPNSDSLKIISAI